MRKNKQHPLWVERMWVALLKVTPLRMYTRLIRGLSQIPLPQRLRQPVFGNIAGRMGIDIEEAELQLEHYAHMGALFTRRLKKGARVIDDSPLSIIAPADGCLIAKTVLRQQELIQAKGIPYRLEELLDDKLLAKAFENGTYFTIYLRPKDYHRVHAPTNGTLKNIRRVKGTLFPVQPYVVRNLRGLFTRNERVIFNFETEHGKMSLICVAAAGVGNISTSLETNSGPKKVEKGQEIAIFNLGSTVIVVFQSNQVVPCDLTLRQEIRVGEPLAEWNPMG